MALRTAWKSVTSAVAGLCAGARVTRGEAMAEVVSSATAPRRVVSCIFGVCEGLCWVVSNKNRNCSGRLRQERGIKSVEESTSKTTTTTKNSRTSSLLIAHPH